MKTAFVYARFSSERQREESIDAQLRAIREYCQRENILIVQEFCDRAKSATTDRPARLRHAPGSPAKSGFRLYVEPVR